MRSLSRSGSASSRSDSRAGGSGSGSKSSITGPMSAHANEEAPARARPSNSNPRPKPKQWLCPRPTQLPGPALVHAPAGAAAGPFLGPRDLARSPLCVELCPVRAAAAAACASHARLLAPSFAAAPVLSWGGGGRVFFSFGSECLAYLLTVFQSNGASGGIVIM
jgi:hypothetical protein